MFKSHLGFSVNDAEKNPTPSSILGNSQGTCQVGWCLVCWGAHTFLFHERENTWQHIIATRMGSLHQAEDLEQERRDG